MSRFRLPGLLPAVLIVANLFLFGPVAVYVGNATEFRPGLGAVLGHLWIPAVVLFVTLYVLALVAHRWKGVEAAWTAILLALGVSTWLQGTIMVWDYGVFGKAAVDWDIQPWRAPVDLTVWAVVLLAALVFRARLVRVAPMVAAVFLGIQAIAAVVAIAQAPSKSDSESTTSTNAAPLWQLSSKQNVIHVVLDELQTDVLEHILSTDPERYETELDGFTLFTDTVGAYPTTIAGLPPTFGGPVYSPEVSLNEYRDHVRASRTTPRMLAEAGYTVDIAAPFDFFDWYRDMGARTLYLLPVPYSTDLEEAFARDAGIVFLAAAFRQVPHPLKKLLYGGGLAVLFPGSTIIGSSIERSEAARHLAHREFLQALIDNADVTTSERLYKFIHLTTTHWPGVVDESCTWSAELQPWNWRSIRVQAKCSFEHFLGFLDRLKELGVYDSALIVLQADHGYWNIRDSHKAVPLVGEDGDLFKATDDFAQVVASARPMLAIKPPGAHGRLIRSDAPAAVTDTQATIAALLEMEAPGDNVFELPPERERRFHYYETLKTRNAFFLGRIDEYRVTGNSLDRRSWHRSGVHRPPGTDYRAARLEFDNKVGPYLLSGWSRGEQGASDTTYIWAMGASASILLELPPDRPSVLAARMATLKFGAPQVVGVRVNGKELGTWTLESISPSQWDTREVVVPPQPAGLSVIELTFEKSADYLPSGDPRPLAVLFDWIEIRDAE